MKAIGTYSIRKWDEKPYSQLSPDHKLTKASVEYALRGQINGKAEVEYLMFYKHFNQEDQHKSVSNYVGLIKFTGTLGEKEGSFVLEDSGTYADGKANSALQIVEGSGEGAFKRIRGAGNYRIDDGGYHFELDYNL